MFSNKDGEKNIRMHLDGFGLCLGLDKFGLAWKGSRFGCFWKHIVRKVWKGLDGSGWGLNENHEKSLKS